MPFYEYQCKNCGHELEAMQKVSDAPLKKCPHCGKSQLQRLMSAPVFRLKGGGWYETDFKGDQDTKRNLADRPEADAPKETDSSSTEAKSDAKSSDAKGSEAKPSDGKTSDVVSGEGAKSKEKPSQKTPVKTPTSSPRPSAKRPVAKKRPTRPVKKVAAKAKRRR
jgi:putative FmdB family regulatory protein